MQRVLDQNRREGGGGGGVGGEWSLCPPPPLDPCLVHIILHMMVHTLSLYESALLQKWVEQVFQEMKQDIVVTSEKN